MLFGNLLGLDRNNERNNEYQSMPVSQSSGDHHPSKHIIKNVKHGRERVADADGGSAGWNRDGCSQDMGGNDEGRIGTGSIYWRGAKFLSEM
ncbi:uncharacterized protein EAE98_003361 [Botrytis deweyae]|uniref:Uncharacterized protein n=1 Tax=Botrytis deweyae TaxID=2478750 RepID=A0ABQ7ITA5_9HELO|nr:uncharacterized protein EAE98_003361 [Botrytis deweyae]KAF7933652.1 hypothetical protein EAE98_003361 [Botrytis deweyae]